MSRARAVLFALLLAATAAPAWPQGEPPLTADSERQAGVPAGRVVKATWTSTVFPGTVRDYWVYVPAQYQPSSPAALMVFQDGGRYVSEEGRWRVPVVFDNLIHRGEMPVTIGVFVDPGVLPARSGEAQPRFNRSFEYDALGGRYARFLLEELLPEIGRSYAVTTDPDLRGIGGSSSGASCAFTVAWSRPDAFRRVLSFIGSYTGLRGADGYPTLIRKTEPKPLRVFLQDGRRDLDIYSGSWWIGNQAMASALDYAGYDVRFVTDEGAHDSLHGSVLLPEALRWLWRDWRSPLAASRGKAGAERHFVTQILEPGEDWQPVFEGRGAVRGLAVDAQGDVYFADAGRVHRLDHRTGQVGIVKAAPVPTGPAVAAARGAATLRRAFGGGLAVSPDRSLAVLADPQDRWVWSYQLDPAGVLRHGQAFYRLETADESPASGAAGLAFDREGWLYVGSRVGVQVFDQPGRVNAILNAPSAAAISGVVFGGPRLDMLYVSTEGKVYRRRVRRQGVPPGPPVKPPTPQL
jgi:gluconolactonase